MGYDFILISLVNPMNSVAGTKLSKTSSWLFRRNGSYQYIGQGLGNSILFFPSLVMTRVWRFLIEWHIMSDVVCLSYKVFHVNKFLFQLPSQSPQNRFEHSGHDMEKQVWARKCSAWIFCPSAFSSVPVSLLWGFFEHSSMFISIMHTKKLT